MPTINKVIRNMFTDDGGTVTVTQAEYDALLRERREIERREGPVAGCADVAGAIADATRLWEICAMLGDEDAARAASARRKDLERESRLQSARTLEAARKYDAALASCLEAAEAVAGAYATLDECVMEPAEVRKASRAELAPEDLAGSAIIARELGERSALAGQEELIARCNAALEAFERPRPRGLADRLRNMLGAVCTEAEKDARTARRNLATIEDEKSRRAEAKRAAELEVDPAARMADMERRLTELEGALSGRQ